MTDIRHRAAAAANEIAQLRDDAYLAGDNELATELNRSTGSSGAAEAPSRSVPTSRCVPA